MFSHSLQTHNIRVSVASTHMCAYIKGTTTFHAATVDKGTPSRPSQGMYHCILANILYNITPAIGNDLVTAKPIAHGASSSFTDLKVLGEGELANTMRILYNYVYGMCKLVLRILLC